MPLHTHTNSLTVSAVITNNTTYYATQTVDSCESKTELVINAYDETLNVSDVFRNCKITLYPNPMREVLNLSLESKINKIIISDYSGRKVLEMAIVGENKVDAQSLVKATTLFRSLETDFETIKFIKD